MSLAAVLSLGELPLVNALVAADDESSREPTYPLDVVRCRECTLVQITVTVPRELVFRDYAYLSSYSDSFLAHARHFANGVIRELELDDESLVVEAASNDGYLLRNFVAAGIPTLGIEPAQNVAEIARNRGVDTLAEFLDQTVARQIVADRGAADLVVANNVLAHVSDLRGFVCALAVLVGDDGVVSVEVPYLRDLVDRLEFDTIYHEHLCYFSVTSLVRLFEPVGLSVVNVERLPVHGGSLRVRLASSGRSDPTVAQLLADEMVWGVAEPDQFERFANAVESLRDDIHDTVASLASGARVAAYGAAAKGVVLANTCRLNRDLLDFVVDRNPQKQGRALPGVRIPVEPVETLVRERPDYCVLFAWNLAGEIIAQQTEYRGRGGRFLVPLPRPELVS